MGMSDSNKRSRARSGGKAAVSTNRWYYLRKVTGYDGRLEVLECGHKQRPKSDMIGEYDAARRRCHQCPKPTLPCATCKGTGGVPMAGSVPRRCLDCDGDGKVLAEPAVLPETWFDALGHPVHQAGRQAAWELLVSQGLDADEASVIIPLIAREVEHDNPERAQKILRNWLPAHGSEILLMRTFAVLCTTPHLVPAR